MENFELIFLLTIGYFCAAIAQIQPAGPCSNEPISFNSFGFAKKQLISFLTNVQLLVFSLSWHFLFRCIDLAAKIVGSWNLKEGFTETQQAAQSNSISQIWCHLSLIMVVSMVST